MVEHAPKAVTLKRDVGWLGSFAMGYGDVGADIFIAIGIVFLYAAGAAPIAFLIAALAYVCIGLVYAELSSVYPYAGGCYLFATKAFNSLIGFIAGWAIMLDYTVNTSLFALAAAGYVKFLLPEIFMGALSIFGLKIPMIGILASVMVIALLFLNYVGIKYSVNFLIMLVIFGVSIITLILMLGYLLTFDPSTFLSQVKIFGNDEIFPEVKYLFPNGAELNNFLYGITIAMISFIGIESISQGAEETRKPYKWIPRAAKLSVIVVVLSVLLMAVLAGGSMDWRKVTLSYENSVAVLVSTFPVVGGFLSVFVAVAAIILCIASSNTGVIGVSRLTASMSKFRLLPRWFYFIHPKYRTPTRTIFIFGGIGAALTLIGDIPFVASIYNFGALLSYMILMMSFLALRIKGRDIYRHWKVPLNIKIGSKSKKMELPIVGIFGLVLTSALWILVVLLHPNALQFGTIWIAMGLILYYVFRRTNRLQISSKEESDWVIPGSYIMEATILVDPMGEYQEALEDMIKRCYDKRFKIKLLSIIPEEFLSEDRIGLTKLISSVQYELDEMANRLRRKGYAVSTDVFIGNLGRAIDHEITNLNVDFVVYIRHTIKEKMSGKNHSEILEKLFHKYPGRIIIM